MWGYPAWCCPEEGDIFAFRRAMPDNKRARIGVKSVKTEECAECEECAHNCKSWLLVISYNIAFARGGAHLPIVHALRLPETEILGNGGLYSVGKAPSLLQDIERGHEDVNQQLTVILILK